MKANPPAQQPSSAKATSAPPPQPSTARPLAGNADLSGTHRHSGSVAAPAVPTAVKRQPSAPAEQVQHANQHQAASGSQTQAPTAAQGEGVAQAQMPRAAKSGTAAAQSSRASVPASEGKASGLEPGIEQPKGLPPLERKKPHKRQRAAEHQAAGLASAHVETSKLSLSPVQQHPLAPQQQQQQRPAADPVKGIAAQQVTSPMQRQSPSPNKRAKLSPASPLVSPSVSDLFARHAASDKLRAKTAGLAAKLAAAAPDNNKNSPEAASPYAKASAAVRSNSSASRQAGTASKAPNKGAAQQTRAVSHTAGSGAAQQTRAALTSPDADSPAADSPSSIGQSALDRAAASAKVAKHAPTGRAQSQPRALQQRSVGPSRSESKVRQRLAGPSRLQSQTLQSAGASPLEPWDTQDAAGPAQSSQGTSGTRTSGADGDESTRPAPGRGQPTSTAKLVADPSNSAGSNTGSNRGSAQKIAVAAACNAAAEAQGGMNQGNVVQQSGYHSASSADTQPNASAKECIDLAGNSQENVPIHLTSSREGLEGSRGNKKRRRPSHAPVIDLT